MSVTDAQFRDLLRGQNRAEIVLLAEIQFAYQTAVGPGTGTIYISDGKYRTKEGETPPRTRYYDVMTKSPSFSRAIDYKTLGGKRAMTAGSMELDNSDGSIDFMLDAIVDGREVRYYVGRGGDVNPWARADFRHVHTALVASVKGTESTITVTLRDKHYGLDGGVVGAPLGTGPNPDRPAPILFGCIKNFDFTPYLVDAANLVYKLNDFALDSSLNSTENIDVRDGGLSLKAAGLFSFDSGTMTANIGTETLTYVAHQLEANDVVILRQIAAGALFAGLSANTQYWVISAGLTADDFRLSLTRGGVPVNITSAVLTGTWRVERRRFYIDAAAATITLSSLPTYRATIDYNVSDAAGELGANQAPHLAFKYLLAHYSTLSTSDYDEAAINAIAATDAGVIRCAISILNRVNLITLLDDIARSTYSWYGWTDIGVLTVGRLDLSNLASATAIATITQADMVDATELRVENLPLRWGKVTVDSDPNTTVQTDSFAGTATAENRAVWSRAYQVRVMTTDPGGTTYSDNWWDYHASAVDSDPIPMAIGTPLLSGVFASSPGQDVCDAVTALFKPWTRVYRETVGIEWYDLNPGDVVELVHSRYGLSGGKNVAVVEVSPSFSDGTCEMVYVAQNDPDYLTASYA